MPDIASAYRSRMKVADLSTGKEIEIFEEVKQSIVEAGIELKNDFSLLELEMDSPSLDDTMPDNERLLRAVEAATGRSEIRMAYSALRKLPDALRKGDFKVQCVIRNLAAYVLLMDVIPMGEKATIGGLAIDIGTTTVSALLVDLETGKILAKGSTGNGQIRYGADVINRIIESTRVGGRKKLKKAIVDETLLPLIDGLCHEAKIPSDGIYRICVAGNTTMNHLLVGVNADPIRMEPYIPAFFETNSVFAVDLGIEVSSSTRVRIAPNVGSYVGGDITGRYSCQRNLESSGILLVHRPGYEWRAGIRQSGLPDDMRLLGRPCLRGRRYQLWYACDRRSYRFLPLGSYYEGADSFRAW